MPIWQRSQPNAQRRLRAKTGSKRSSVGCACCSLENVRAIRVGAKNDAQRKLDAALAQYGFESAEKARDENLSEDEFVILEAEIEEYKRDFAATLEKCQRIEEGEGQGSAI